MLRDVLPGQDRPSEQPFDEAQRKFLTEIYDSYRKPLRAYCRFLMHGDPAAEDLAHETFITAAKDPDKMLGRPPQQQLWWLKMLASQGKARKLRKMDQVTSLSLTGEDIEIASPADDYGNMVLFIGTRDRLQRAAKILSPDDRQILGLLLRREAGITDVPDIAAALGISGKAANTRKSRLRGAYGRIEQALLAVDAGEHCEKAHEITNGKPLTLDLAKEVTSHAGDCGTCTSTRKRLRKVLGIIGIGTLGYQFSHSRPRGPGLRDVADSQDLASDPGGTDLMQPGAAPAAGTGGLAGRAAASRRAWLAVAAVALVVLGLGIFTAHPGQATSLAGAAVRPPAGAASARSHYSEPSVVRPAATARPAPSGPGRPGQGRPHSQRAADTGSQPSPGPGGRSHPAPSSGATPAPSASTAPAAPATPDVSLSVSGNQLLTGQAATVEAQASSSLTGTPYTIRIMNQALGTTLQECTSGTVCEVPVNSATPTTQSYTAQVERSTDGTVMSGPTSPADVTWSAPQMTFSADTTTPLAGGTVHLTASLNLPMDGSPYFLRLYDSQHHILANCTAGQTCSAAVSEASGSVFYAHLDSGNGGPPFYPVINVASVTVMWPPPPRPPIH